mmetsp:Transcript_106447/g.243721  ORF Transcript_106447/g.243721 Transcript_106447/m.243721 type:complete len:201 (+) Transcript_106447:1071-1673(+)
MLAPSLHFNLNRLPLPIVRDFCTAFGDQHRCIQSTLQLSKPGSRMLLITVQLPHHTTPSFMPGNHVSTPHVLLPSVTLKGKPSGRWHRCGASCSRSSRLFHLIEAEKRILNREWLRAGGFIRMGSLPAYLVCKPPLHLTLATLTLAVICHLLAISNQHRCVDAPHHLVKSLSGVFDIVVDLASNLSPFLVPSYNHGPSRR